MFHIILLRNAEDEVEMQTFPTDELLHIRKTFGCNDEVLYHTVDGVWYRSHMYQPLAWITLWAPELNVPGKVRLAAMLGE